MCLNLQSGQRELQYFSCLRLLCLQDKVIVKGMIWILLSIFKDLHCRLLSTLPKCCCKVLFFLLKQIQYLSHKEYVFAPGQVLKKKKRELSLVSYSSAGFLNSTPPFYSENYFLKYTCSYRLCNIIYCQYVNLCLVENI